MNVKNKSRSNTFDNNILHLKILISYFKTKISTQRSQTGIIRNRHFEYLVVKLFKFILIISQFICSKFWSYPDIHIYWQYDESIRVNLDWYVTSDLINVDYLCQIRRQWNPRGRVALEKVIKRNYSLFIHHNSESILKYRFILTLTILLYY